MQPLELFYTWLFVLHTRTSDLSSFLFHLLSPSAKLFTTETPLRISLSFARIFLMMNSEYIITELILINYQSSQTFQKLLFLRIVAALLLFYHASISLFPFLILPYFSYSYDFFFAQLFYEYLLNPTYSIIFHKNTISQANLLLNAC